LATSFPTGLDVLTNPTSADSLASPDHAAQHANVNDAIEAIEAQIGTTASPVLARLASPTFTGTPTLPTGTIATTQTAADSSTKVATTAFVTTANNLKQNLPVGTAWTPTLANGTWTNITFTGRYVQANKLVQFWILGTATGVCALGTGFNIPLLNFPVAPQNANAGAGHSVIITKTTTTYTGITDVGASSSIRPMVHLASGTYTTTAQLADAVPVAWASGMTIWISGVYEAS
jgi:hypothetical protein